jgi:hypothetical protein
VTLGGGFLCRVRLEAALLGFLCLCLPAGHGEEGGATLPNPGVYLWRETRVGVVVKNERTTWTLILGPDPALEKTIERRRLSPPLSTRDDGKGWEREESLRGRVDFGPGGKELVLSVSAPLQKRFLCGWEETPARSPRSEPRGGKDCGVSVWKPGNLRLIKVFACREEGAREALLFASSPGVERYEVNNDCVQGETLRNLPR